MARTILGIDPGLDGGIAAIRAGELVLLERMPVWSIRDGHRQRRGVDGEAFAAILAEADPDVAYLENCYGRRNDRAGPQSAFGFGGAWWVLLDRLRAAGIESYMIQPREWQRALLKLRGRVNSGDTKVASIKMAAHLFPGANLRRVRSNEPHHGLSDAICIAYYGSLQVADLGEPGPPPPTHRRGSRNRRRPA